MNDSPIDPAALGLPHTYSVIIDISSLQLGNGTTQAIIEESVAETHFDRVR